MFERDLRRADVQQQTLDQVFDWLNVPRWTVESPVRPPFRRSYEELVLNYDELEARTRAFAAQRGVG